MFASDEQKATAKWNSKSMLQWLDYFNTINARAGCAIAQYKNGTYEIVSTVDNKKTAAILRKLADDIEKGTAHRHEFKKPN